MRSRGAGPDTLSERAEPRRLRVGLFTASPIYYHVPLYRRVAADPDVDFTAIFASDVGVRPHNAGFGAPVVWDVDLLSGYNSTFLRGAAKCNPGPSFFSVRNWDVVRQILKGDYDVLWVHGYNSLAHTLALITQLLRGRPLLIREEQNLLSPRPRWKRLLKWAWLRIVFARAYALSIGSANRQWFKHYGVPEPRIFMVPYTVEANRLRSVASQTNGEHQPKAAIRNRFGISDGAGPVILNVARLIDKKQPLFLLEAFRRLRMTDRCCLLIVGSGELETAIRARVTAGDIPDVHLPGFLNQTEIAEAYRCADIFVLASKVDETWGVVVNEAMTFQLPVVVSNRVGSHADLVRDGRNGFVVPHDDVEVLSDRLRTLVRDVQLRRTFGAASYQIIQDWNYEVAYQGLKSALVAASSVLTGPAEGMAVIR